MNHAANQGEVRDTPPVAPASVDNDGCGCLLVLAGLGLSIIAGLLIWLEAIWMDLLGFALYALGFVTGLGALLAGMGRLKNNADLRSNGMMVCGIAITCFLALLAFVIAREL
jgi:hypothetical protein